MRPASLLAVLLLALPLAGCVSQSLTPAQLPALDPRSIVVPAGAVLETLPGGIALRWLDAKLPFAQNVTIPPGTTTVRLTAERGAQDAVAVGMANAETGRRRCNTLTVESWDVPILGRSTCTGLAAVDDLPAAWVVRASGPGPTDALGNPAGPALAKLVRVEFLTAPLDGPAASIDASQLSKPTMKLKPTEKLSVPSFDGTPLYVEVTRPDAPGKFPVVIWSSPYSEPDHVAGQPVAWSYFVKDWAMRGYAVVAADVRGYAHSGGCVEVWGPNEQKDQAFLVDWASKQEWSDGNVGFYGQSYVGTTPVEAAVQAPAALKAIIAVAPVVNSYDDWHFGGVPNGEAWGSVLAYQALTGGAGNAEPTDLDGLLHIANGVCDPTLIVRADDPRAVYDAFYAERNFSVRAKDVKAAVLYTQGFVDHNVKSAMIPWWFNGITAPKLGLFGPWVHQHPTRADNELLMLAWLEQYLKGKDVGLGKLAPAYVTTAQGTMRAAQEWPPLQPAWSASYADLGAGRWDAQPKEGEAQLLMDGTGQLGAAGAVTGALPTALTLQGKLAQDVRIAGQGVLHLRAQLAGADNAYVAAFVHDVAGDGKSKEVTFGMANLAHRNGHDQYAPVSPGETVDMDLPFLPTEYTLPAGHTLKVEVRATQNADWDSAEPSKAGVLTLLGGAQGTQLRWPLAPEPGAPTPASAQP